MTFKEKIVYIESLNSHIRDTKTQEKLSGFVRFIIKQ